MMLRKPARGVAVAGAMTALMVGLAMGPALAATRTWTVKPGGKVTAKSGKTTLTDKADGLSMSCTSSVAKTRLKKGRHLSGKGIGKITSINFKGCTGPAGVTITVKSAHLPWKLNAVSYNKRTGVTRGTIRGIHATISASVLQCTMTVDGTSATANNGMVKVTYKNKTHVLKVLAGGGNLHIYNPTAGCQGLVTSGDASSFAASYKVSPKQKITSP